MANYINSTLEDVKFHIETQDFDGPIDLLVKFVKEAKIDVMEIFVSDITTQYVQYVQTLQELNYEYVSQYIIFAAILVEIKSSKLTPTVTDDLPTYGEDPDAYGSFDETEAYIMEQVRQKLLMEYPEKLKPREVINVFYASPQYNENDYKLVAKNLTLDKLLDAYKLLLEKVEFTENAPPVQTIVKDRFTVSEKVSAITGRVRKEKKISFFSLFESDYTKTEMLTVFLAVLEVIRRQIAFATQTSFESDIQIEYNESEKGDFVDETNE